MAQKLKTSQTRQRTVLPMVGNAVDEAGDLVLSKIDAQLAKHFEDRNVLLTDGGIITFTGTTVLFTEALKLSLNSKIDGSVQTFDLGSTTRAFSANGRMLYAVIDRTAGTATVTADAAALPSVVAANQEVFLIAKRVDAAGSLARVYFRNGSGFTVGASARLGAAGSGKGSGTGGGELVDLLYSAQITDAFSNIPDGNTTVDISAGKTDATLFDPAKELFRLSYDASKTISTTGTAATLSAGAAFTVKIGDVVTSGLETRRISALASQTSFTLDFAFSTNLVAAACNVSQAVHTTDLNAFTAGGLGLSAASQFSGNIDEIMVGYEDSTTLGDIIPDYGVAPVIAFSASSDGTNYTAPKNRATSLSNTESAVTCPTSSTNLYMRFFSNATTGSGAVNFLGYKVFFQKMVGGSAGSPYLTAFSRPTSSINQNVSHSVFSGKSRFTFTFGYPRGLNPAEASGSALSVYANGQRVPRFTSGVTDSTQAFFTEISENVIEMDTDYSAAGIDFQFMVRANIVDTSVNNVTQITNFGDILDQQLDAQVIPTYISAVNASPSAIQFRSDITGRASIINPSNALAVQMGPQRMTVQEIYQIQGEIGPSGQPVFGASNDKFNQIRFVGSGWVNFIDSQGPSPITNVTNDYIEVVFYGTGLNLLVKPRTATNNISISVDGGSSSTLDLGNRSIILQGRNYCPNQIFTITSGLSLGIHTVKMTYTSALDFQVYGFEVLTETTSLRVAPGIAAKGRYKNLLSSLQTVAFDSTFESGSLGTKGGNVLLYLKTDGTIAKSVTPTDTSLLYLTNASHANEEVIKTYNYREFSAGRSDDYSDVSTTSNRAFTLDDGVTSLVGSGVLRSTGAGGDGIATQNLNSFLTFTFVGTGLDLYTVAGAPSQTDAIAVTVDDVSAGSITLTSVGTIKICSGLPYGTHTVRFLRSASAVGQGFFSSFITYGPKKPALPAGAIEIAQFYKTADYVAGTGTIKPSVGAIRRAGNREIVYNNTWSVALDPLSTTGFEFFTATNGAYFEYTFFGTGIELTGYQAASARNYTYSIDGSSNLSAFTTNFYSPATGMTFTPATGVLSGTPSVASYGATLSIRGLPLGRHIVRVTKNAGGDLYCDSVDVITPIHASGLNIPNGAQNALNLGNLTVSDLRKFNKRDSLITNRTNISQAKGLASTPSTSSTSFVPMPDMSITHFNTTGRISISYQGTMFSSTNGVMATQIYVDGVPVGVELRPQASTGGIDFATPNSAELNVTPGFHKIDVYWRTNAGTLSGSGISRFLTVKES
jgi:hypothetical protein